MLQGGAPSELPAGVRSALLKAASETGGEPLVITFATAGFAPLLRNWAAHARRAGASAPLVVAMGRGPNPDAALAGFSAVPLAFDGSLADLWRQRLHVFEFLAASGVDFIHSDVDAVWLADPRPVCFADASLDLVFSQGTTYPTEIWREWGFVLCCGLFAARGRQATAAFFAEARNLARTIGDDQVVVNFLLYREGLAWELAHQDRTALSIRDQIFSGFRRMIAGDCDRLGLRVGMLPHRLVPRLPEPAPGALVKHPLGPGNPPEKAAILRAVGCWIADGTASSPG